MSETPTLFSSHRDAKTEPLAYRMRPRTLDEYVGQEHIIGKGRLLRRAIQADQLSSVIFYGPPGTGKTTLARVIANTTKRYFSTLNAVLTGVKELREEIDAAKRRMDAYGLGTILFVDEVHRWNKSQQDALLPWVENGTVIFIGATTENPFFEVNAALVSRSRIFQLKALTKDDLHRIAMQAIEDKERGYGAYRIRFEDGALEHLVDVAGGDARSLLNALQLAVETSVEPFPPTDPDTEILITREAAEESIQRKVVLYDKEGDYHFDVISAFIKSLRGSDPDAALYWLAKMVAAGEDPRFIFRRMLISATEDVGLADPRAIQVVEADADAFDRIGLPEGRFHLAHAALYLATAPKSNSTLGFFDALKAVEQEEAGTEVPNHLRDANRDAKGFGHGEGYLYPHSYKDHWVAQQYLPDTLQGKIFYQPGNLGYERTIASQVRERREEQIENAAIDLYQENLSFSPGGKARDAWVSRTISERGAMLGDIKSRLYSAIAPTRSDRILVLGAGYGLLLWPAFQMVPEGLVVAQVDTDAQKAYIDRYAGELEDLERPRVFQGPVDRLWATLEDGLAFEAVVGRNQLTRLAKDRHILEDLKPRLAPGAVLSFAQIVPAKGSRLSDFVDDPGLKERLKDQEAALFAKDVSDLAGWDDEDLERAFQESGYHAECSVKEYVERRHVTRDNLASWLEGGYQASGITPDQLSGLCRAPLSWRHHVVFVRASLGALPPTGGRKHDQDWDAVEAKTRA